jgi:hypothetical protein
MVVVREARFPYKVYGVVVPDTDDNYNVYINGNISDNKKIEAVTHEMKHIQRGDCHSEEDCAVIEGDV